MQRTRNDRCWERGIPLYWRTIKSNSVLDSAPCINLTQATNTVQQPIWLLKNKTLTILPNKNILYVLYIRLFLMQSLCGADTTSAVCTLRSVTIRLDNMLVLSFIFYTILDGMGNWACLCHALTIHICTLCTLTCMPEINKNVSVFCYSRNRIDERR